MARLSAFSPTIEVPNGTSFGTLFLGVPPQMMLRIINREGVPNGTSLDILSEKWCAEWHVRWHPHQLMMRIIKEGVPKGTSLGILSDNSGAKWHVL